MNTTRSSLVSAAVAVSALVALVPATPAHALPPLPAPNSNGITLTAITQVGGDPRMLDATMTTGAIFRPGANPSINPTTVPVHVRIYLPDRYTTDPAHPYPVLLLLHGGGGDFEQWSKDGDIKTIVGGSPFRGIVVMPEGGKSGWYNDWPGETDGHFAPAWEMFHIGQLLPWIDANFNTTRSRSGRAVAGLSMGGFGALKYAAAHPTVFSAVGAFSPGTDVRQPEAQNIVNTALLVYGAAFSWNGLLDGNYRISGDTDHRLRTVFGDPAGWSSINPIELAARYTAYNTRFGLYVGQGPSDSGEAQLGRWTDTFHARLSEVPVLHRYCRGPGAHSFDYWKPDLADFLAYVYGAPNASCPNGWGAPAS